MAFSWSNAREPTKPASRDHFAVVSPSIFKKKRFTRNPTSHRYELLADLPSQFLCPCFHRQTAEAMDLQRLMAFGSYGDAGMQLACVESVAIGVTCMLLRFHICRPSGKTRSWKLGSQSKIRIAAVRAATRGDARSEASWYAISQHYWFAWMEPWDSGQWPQMIGAIGMMITRWMGCWCWDCSWLSNLGLVYFKPWSQSYFEG